MPEWWNGIHSGLKIRRFGLRVRIPPRVPNAPVAQLVEQRTFNPKVAGSNPAGGTILAPVAQRRSRGLIILWLQVRILPGAPYFFLDSVYRGLQGYRIRSLFLLSTNAHPLLSLLSALQVSVNTIKTTSKPIR